MADKPETTKALKTASQELKRVEQAQKTIEVKLKALDEKVRADSKNKVPALGSVHGSALEQLIQDINGATADNRSAVGPVMTVVSDKAFVSSHLKTVEDLQALNMKLTDRLVENYRLAKELQNLAEENVQKLATRPDYAFEVASKYEKQATELSERIQGLRKQLEPLCAKAKKCQLARDAKGLAEAKKAVAALSIEKAWEDHERLAERVDSAELVLIKKVSGDARAQAQIKDGLADIRDSLESSSITARHWLSEAREVASLEVSPIDVKKAMKAFGITAATAEAKLAKVLKEAPAGLQRGLGELSRELKLSLTGAAMLELLKKNKLI